MKRLFNRPRHGDSKGACIGQTADVQAGPETTFRLLVDHSPAGVFMLDDSFRCLVVNEAAAKIAERPRDSMIGLDFRDLLDADTRQAITRIDRKRGDTVPQRYQPEILTPSGTRKRVEMVIGVLPDAPDGAVFFAQAVTAAAVPAERSGPEQPAGQVRLDVLRTIISDTNHALKTPLTVIQTSLYLLERHTDPQKRQEKIEMVRTQAALLNHLVHDLLVLCRLDYLPQLDREDFDLNETVQQAAAAIRLPAETKRVTVQLELDPTLPPLNADREALSRALANLLDNAVSYTPDSQAITVRTEQRDGQIIVTVADTGMGIESEAMPLIFNRFYRSPKARALAANGAGLGLAVVERVAALHGGRVEVESVPAEGSTFRLFLPLHTGAEPPSDRP